MGPIVFTEISKKDINSIGSVRANSEAGATNFLRIEECDECNTRKPKLHYTYIAEPAGKFLTTVTIEGHVYTLPEPIPLDKKHDVLKAVAHLLCDGDGGLQQTNSRVWSCINEDNSLEFYSLGKLSVTLGVDGADVESQPLCDYKTLCPFKFSGVGEDDTVKVDGVEILVSELGTLDNIFGVEFGEDSYPTNPPTVEPFLKFWACKPIRVTSVDGMTKALECGDCKCAFFNAEDQIIEAEGKEGEVIKTPAQMTKPELLVMANELGVEGAAKLNKADLLEKLLQKQADLE